MFKNVSDSEFYADFNSVTHFPLGFPVDLQFDLKVMKISIKLIYKGSSLEGKGPLEKTDFRFEISIKNCVG